MNSGEAIRVQKAAAERKIMSAVQEFFDITGIRAEGVRIDINMHNATHFTCEGGVKSETFRVTHLEDVNLEVVI